MSFDFQIAEFLSIKKKEITMTPPGTQEKGTGRTSDVLSRSHGTTEIKYRSLLGRP